MNLLELMADLRATRRFPTEEEVALVIREGTLEQVAEAMVNTCCMNQDLRDRYNVLRRVPA